MGDFQTSIITSGGIAHAPRGCSVTTATTVSCFETKAFLYGGRRVTSADSIFDKLYPSNITRAEHATTNQHFNGNCQRVTQESCFEVWRVV